MREAGTTSQIAVEMRRHKLAVLGICETLRTRAGWKWLDSGKSLLFSVHEEENVSYTRGVILMLSKEARKALIGWKSHGSRIIKASFKTKEVIIMNVIECYAPTNDSNDDDENQFYKRLQ
ncbi:unnamed protein product [Schistosoma curassoni]|uniref:Reverse transcriptase n=1 Tax=Schistosoma curassoni TaxID=6186 RepID=A0A183L791_9TREM|nr:unnamed protein product [Schistosoma curassoni]